jgi:hypothetical protein
MNKAWSNYIGDQGTPPGHAVSVKYGHGWHRGIEQDASGQLTSSAKLSFSGLWTKSKGKVYMKTVLGFVAMWLTFPPNILAEEGQRNCIRYNRCTKN